MDISILGNTEDPDKYTANEDHRRQKRNSACFTSDFPQEDIPRQYRDINNYYLTPGDKQQPGVKLKVLVIFL